MKEICDHLEIDKTRTSPYHPQGNAQVERYNQTIMSICSKLTDKEHYQNWDEKLPISVSAYNATEHSTTGKTPNRLMMGREISHNFDKMLPEATDPAKIQTWDEYVQAVDEDTREAFQAAREATGRAVLIYKKHYDRSSHLNKFQVGDPLMLRDFKKLEKGTKKLADPYDGPYYVLDVLSDVNFRISKSENSEPKIVHHDRMKPIEQDEKPNLDWVFKQSRTYARDQIQQGGANLQLMKDVTDRLAKLEREITKNSKKIARRNKKATEIRKRKRTPGAKEKTPETEEKTPDSDDKIPDIEEKQLKPEENEVEKKPKRGRPRKGETKRKQTKPIREGERRSERIRTKAK